MLVIHLIHQKEVLSTWPTSSHSGLKVVLFLNQWIMEKFIKCCTSSSSSTERKRVDNSLVLMECSPNYTGVVLAGWLAGRPETIVEYLADTLVFFLCSFSSRSSFFGKMIVTLIYWNYIALLPTILPKQTHVLSFLKKSLNRERTMATFAYN